MLATKAAYYILKIKGGSRYWLQLWRGGGALSPPGYHSMELAGVAVGSLAHDSCKITVVGAGSVGVAAAYALLIKSLAKPLILIDVFENKVLGETKDLQHAVSFTNSEAVIGGTDFSITEGSKICVITAGKRQSPGQTRLELLEDNVRMLNNIITELIKYSPEAFYIIATNPVDVLSYTAWKITGLPQCKVFGTGTHLDSSRFKYYISESSGVPIHNIEAYIIGEHGESAVPVWSSMRLAGRPMSQFEDLFTAELREEIHQKVVNSAQEIISLKGYTSAAIGLSIADIVEAIILNKNKIICLSTLVKDVYQIDNEVFTSLPCMVGGNGISHIIPNEITDEEKRQLHESVEALKSCQEEVDQIINS